MRSLSRRAEAKALTSKIHWPGLFSIAACQRFAGDRFAHSLIRVAGAQSLDSPAHVAVTCFGDTIAEQNAMRRSQRSHSLPLSGNLWLKRLCELIALGKRPFCGPGGPCGLFALQGPFDWSCVCFHSDRLAGAPKPPPQIIDCDCPDCVCDCM